MFISLVKILSKILPVYGIKESNFLGEVVFRIKDFEDKPHIRSICVDDNTYVKYSDIFFSHYSANNQLKKKKEQTFLEEVKNYPKENVEMAERLESMGLIDPIGFKDILQNGVNSKTYKDLYESQG